MEEKEIGYVSNFFGHISVAAIELTDGPLMTGDTIHFKGHTTDVKCRVQSMQIEHQIVSQADKGDSIGLKITEKVRKADKVFKVTGS